MEINNRRYIGCKTKLLSFIETAIPENIRKSNYSFADVFAGTGVVGYYFASKGHSVLVNDSLYSNYVIYKTFFSDEEVDEKKLKTIIKDYNNINSNDLEHNYFSEIYGNKYYSNNDAKKIGFIRDDIEKNKNKLKDREYYTLLTSLLYAADKIANTCGHFESYLKKQPIDKGVILEYPSIKKIESSKSTNLDANALVKNIKYDIVYLDPPYNARQYVNFYHVLENLARWSKPSEFEGESMKFKRDNLKSGYCRSNASKLFEELINSIDAKLILVSYSNTYTAKSTASNNRIIEDELVRILNNKGKTSIKETKYKYFNSGKTDFSNHLEKIYICEVNKK